MLFGVAGLSAMGIFGAVRVFNLWQQAQRLRRRDAEMQEEEMKSLSFALNACEIELEDRKRTVESLREEIARLGERVQDAETELDAMEKQNQILVNKTKALMIQNKQLEGELQRHVTEQKELKELLDLRTGELKGAQAFLTKADQFAGGDVTKLVQQLNAEILQTAASMAEDLIVEEKKIDTEGKQQESDETTVAITRTEEIIGPRLTELLRTSEHHEDAILIQMAFQTGIAAYTHWMISSWCFESPEDEHMLSEIYARVREAGRFESMQLVSKLTTPLEEQAVSGRWRQLTRAHLQRMLAHEPDLIPDLAEALANILVAAGYKENPVVTLQRIMARFGDPIGTLIRLARDLNKKVGEGVTSCDLEVLYISPDIPFHATNMEDALGATSGDGNEKVLCTLDLGLVRAERLSGSIAHWNEYILLKPKVILPSGLVGIVGSAES